MTKLDGMVEYVALPSLRESILGIGIVLAYTLIMARALAKRLGRRRLPSVN